MEYEWDEGKREANRIKHGVDFLDVVGFDWEGAALAEDRRSDYGEQRRVALGFIDAGCMCWYSHARQSHPRDRSAQGQSPGDEAV